MQHGHGAVWESGRVGEWERSEMWCAKDFCPRLVLVVGGRTRDDLMERGIANAWGLGICRVSPLG